MGLHDPIPQVQVLNQNLYQQLLQYANGAVGISNHGYRALVAKGSDGRQVMLSPGEKYRVNCPECGDKRGRLWVHHLWCVHDPDTGSWRQHWVHCFNENCMQDGDNLERFRKQIYPLNGQVRPARSSDIRRGKQPKPWTGEAIELPGDCPRLSELPPTHPVREYLRHRRFDPDVLAEEWDVRHCDSSDEYPALVGRIVAPVVFNGKLVAWQGRIPSFTNRRTKYYNLHGPWRSQVLYGYDRAKPFRFAVLTEGVTNVWRMGPPVCATFGKGISPAQAIRVAETWGRSAGGSGVVVVFADDMEAYHAAEPVFDHLSREHGIAVIAVTDPHGRDPADLSVDEAWATVANGCAEAGIDFAALMGARDEGTR